MSAETKQADLFDPNAKNEMMDRNSRNADALGLDTMRNLTSLSILVVGMKGVGVETAKNLVLAGPGAVTLWDPEITKIADLGTNFYLREEHVGKVSRAQASFPQVKSLHPYCKTSVYEGPLEEAVLGKFGVIIVTEILPKAEITRLNDYCRSKGITFILAWNFGLAAAIFADHGDNHQCTDLDGNPTTELVIEHVDVDQKEGIISVKITGDQHGWDEGQEVLFSKMEGQLAWLNGLKNVFIKRKMRKQADLDAKGNPKKDAKGNLKYREINELNTFIVDLSKAAGVPANLGTYKRGGYVSNVKPGKLFKFRSFSASLTDPHVNDAHKYFSMSKMDMVSTVYHPDQWKRERERGNHLFAAFSAVLEFYSATGALPKLHDRADALEVIRLSKEGIELKGATDDTLTYRLALTARTEVPGYCAFLGGVAAQEVMKRWGKWTPLYQWMVLDELNLLKMQPNCDPDWGCVDDCTHKRAPLDAVPLNSRYDHQIALFGQGFQKHIGNQKWFVVGCGALGCEYLKGIALMGIGAGERGLITVTDMDTIELSNLSRQFLFREEHLGQFKAVAGTNVALGMNPDLNFRVLQEPVGPTTEAIFTDEFWNEQTGIWNALDNVDARKYTDKKCLFHGLPLLESGTEGTKTNSEIIIPFQTSTYNDGKDMETGGIAQCTLRNFPSTIIHCIEWAKPLFTEVFNQAAQDYNALLEDKEKFLELADNQGAQQLSFLQNVKKFHDTFQVRTYAKCLEQAFLLMDTQFTKRIKDLTHLFPEDARKIDSKTKKDQGAFWSGHKRFPKAISLKFEDPEAVAELAKIEAEIAGVEAQPDSAEKSAQLEALDGRKRPVADQVEMVKMQFQFLFGGANLFATVLGLPVQKEEEFLATLRAANLQHPTWAPPAEGSVDVEDDSEKKEKKEGEEEKEGAEDDDAKIGELRQFFEGLSTAGVAPFKPQKFEKDDDTNFHVDWVTAASNLRAYNYQIDLATRHRVKMVAGNIIPALATTTALITGLIEIEFYKLAMGLQYQEPSVFRNAQVNLGLSSFEMSAPPVAIRKKDEVQVFVDANGIAEKKVVTKMYPRGASFTSWNAIEVAEGDITIGEFLELFPKRYHGVRVSSLMAGAFVLYPPVLTPTLQFEKQLANAKAENQKKVFQKMLDNALASNAAKLKNVGDQKVRDRYVELGGDFPTPHRNYILLGGSFDVPDNEAEAKENVAVGAEDGLPTVYEAEVPQIRFIFKHPEAPPVPGRA